jgi:hypothetical protein
MTPTSPPPIPPQAILNQMLMGYVVTQGIYSVAKLNIADKLQDGAKNAEELAQATDSDAPSLFRLMRLLTSFGIFSRDAENRFSLTPVSECLVADRPGSLRDFAIFMGHPDHWRVYGETLYSIQTVKKAAEKVFQMPPWEYLAQNEEFAQVFDRAMTSFTSGIAPAVAAAYDFSKFETLADIGGGHGILLAEILKANPHLQGTLFDQPYVVEGARNRFEKEGLAERCQLVGGNFFESVPQGCDAYLMKHIIHDWDDELAAKILMNCRDAMKVGGTLLLVEMVVAETDEPSFAKILDIEMLLIPGGKERTQQEYDELFEKCGFKLLKVHPTPSPVNIIEAVRI